MNEVFPLVSVLTKLNDRIMEHGFLASLKEITEKVREVWKPGEQIPMTFGFFKKNVIGDEETRGVGYWQPGWSKEFAKQAEIVVFCRAQVQLGAVEVLNVQETWRKDDSGNRVGEMVQIICQRKDDVIAGLLQVAAGKKTKYLTPAVFTTQMEIHNPVLNPWATDETLFEHWGVQPDQHTSLAKVLADGVEEYLRQYQQQRQQPPSLEDAARTVGCNPDQLRFLQNDKRHGQPYVQDVKRHGNELVLHIRDSGIIGLPDQEGCTTTLHTGGNVHLRLTPDGIANLTNAIGKKDMATLFDLDSEEMAEQPASAHYPAGVYFRHRGNVIVTPLEAKKKLLEAIR